MVVAASIVLGLFVGSYLGVVADRLPEGRSTTSGRSHCDSCDATLHWYEMLPVLSYVALRGRCRHCGNRVAVRSTVIEAATAALFGAMAWRFGFHWELGAYLTLAGAFVVLTAIDLRTKKLPRRIIYITGALGVPFLITAAVLDDRLVRLEWAVFGALGALAFFLVLYIGWRNAMGDGDVRLAGLLGFFLGWIGPMHVPVGLFLGFLAGALVGVVVLVAGKGDRSTALPFGPFLAVGTTVAILWGQPIIRLWLHD
jgi:leader peptidase (prepilin peptidase)/N-methyltransferase